MPAARSALDDAYALASHPHSLRFRRLRRPGRAAFPAVRAASVADRLVPRPARCACRRGWPQQAETGACARSPGRQDSRPPRASSGSANPTQFRRCSTGLVRSRPESTCSSTAPAVNSRNPRSTFHSRVERGHQHQFDRRLAPDAGDGAPLARCRGAGQHRQYRRRDEPRALWHRAFDRGPLWRRWSFPRGAVEWAASRCIRVNCIAPGAIETEGWKVYTPRRAPPIRARTR